MNLCVLIEDKAGCSSPPPSSSSPPSIDTNHNTSKHAPNRILNYDALKELIEPELTICPICKCSNRKLVEGGINGLSRDMRIQCESCLLKDLSLQWIMYLHLSF